MNKKKFLITNTITIIIMSLITILFPIKVKNETGFIVTFIYYLLYNVLVTITLYQNTSSYLKKDILNISIIYLYTIINITIIIFLIVLKFIYINTSIIIITILLFTLASFLLLYSLVNGNKYINNQEEKMKKACKKVNEWQMRLEIVLNNCENEELKDDLSNLYELVKYMDPVENEKTYTLDNIINNLLTKLETEQNITVIKEITKKINERKVIISSNK